MRAIAAAVLLLAGIVAHAAGPSSLAEHSGFLLGAAHHCGVDDARVVRVGQRMMALIGGYAEDTQAAEADGKRFAEFLVATRTAPNDGASPVRCGTVSAEFSRLERHLLEHPARR
jgi:hypothetical protein